MPGPSNFVQPQRVIPQPQRIIAPPQQIQSVQVSLFLLTRVF